MKELSVYLSCPVCEHVFKYTPDSTEKTHKLVCFKCGHYLVINYGVYLHVTLRGNQIMLVDELQMEEA